MSEGINRVRTERLAAAIMAPIKANYSEGPVSRERVLEALNSLAFVVANTVALGDDGSEDEAFQFFVRALAINRVEADTH